MSKDINIRIDNGFQHEEVLNAFLRAGLSPLSRESCRYVRGEGFSIRGKVFDKLPDNFMRLSISVKGFMTHYLPQMLEQNSNTSSSNTVAKGTAAGRIETRSIYGFGVVVRASEYNKLFTEVEQLRARVAELEGKKL